MDLFKNFTRGQENAQDQLNANFAALEGAVIVDSGSNANGNWIKFADGTMIQYSSKITTPAPNVQIGSIWRSESMQIDFPLDFSGLKTPAVSINVDSDAGYAWPGLGTRAVGNDGATVVIFSATKNDNTAKVSITAIGRWK